MLVHLFITFLMIICVLLSVFRPGFIVGTPLETIADNSNTTLILTFLAFLSPLYTLLSQIIKDRGKRTLHYDLCELGFRPEHYDLFVHKKGIAQAIPNMLRPDGGKPHILQFGDFLGPDSLWIPFEASFSTEDVCESIKVRHLRVKYYDGSHIAKWKKLRISMPPITSRKIPVNYRKGEKIPLYFLLGLTQEQRELLKNNQFKLIFRQKLRFAGGIRSVKQVTLRFFLSDAGLQLLG